MNIGEIWQSKEDKELLVKITAMESYENCIKDYEDEKKLLMDIFGKINIYTLPEIKHMDNFVSYFFIHDEYEPNERKIINTRPREWFVKYFEKVY